MRFSRIFGMRLTKAITKKKLTEGEFMLTGIHRKRSKFAIRNGIPGLLYEEIITRITGEKGEYDIALDTSAWQVKSSYNWEGEQVGTVSTHLPFAPKVQMIPYVRNEKGDWTVRAIANEKTTRMIYYKK